MRNVQEWRELYRCDDAQRARIIATCVQAMEFDARLIGAPERYDDAGDDHLGRPPYRVVVRPYDWPDLADVLDEIIEEQIEFDRRHALEISPRERQRLMLAIGIVIVVESLTVLGLMRWTGH